MTDTEQGRVVISYGQEAIIENAAGQLQRCNLRRRVGRPVCGDYVQWRPASETDGVIEAIEPRRNLLARPDYRARLRPLAANIDLVVIVAAPEPEFTLELIDRYLVLAENLGIRPCVWINKIDMLEPDAQDRLLSPLQQYEALGYSVLAGSTHTGEGMSGLVELLRAGTSVLVGQSGVGKSSLVRKLLPEQEIRVGALSHASGQGKHTTTETTLYHLPDGGDLIDSPGIRTLRLGHLQPQDIAEGFVEIRQYLGQCRFNNCLHGNEPDCAVAAAAKRGDISSARLTSYRQIVLAEREGR